MIVSTDVVSRLLESAERAGIKLTSRPVQALALNPELLEAVKKQKEAILTGIDSEYREQAEKVLDAIVSSAEAVRDGLAGKNAAVRNVLLSYTLAALNGWGVHTALVKETVKNLPELYSVTVSGHAAYILVPTDEELKKVEVNPALREQVEHVLKSYLQNCLKLDSTGRLEVAGVVLTVVRDAALVSLLHEIGKKSEARDLVYSIVKSVLDRNVQSYVDGLEMPSPDTIVITIRKSALYVSSEVLEAMKNVSIAVRAKVSYASATLHEIHTEIESDIAVVRIPEPDRPIDRVDEVVKSAASSAQTFLNYYAPLLVKATEEARKLGFAVTPHRVDMGFGVEFARESLVTHGGRSAKVQAHVRASLELPMTERVEGRVKVDAGSEAIKSAVIGELKKLNLERDFSAYELSISDAGKSGFEIVLSDIRIEKLPDILGAVDIIAKDVEALLRQAMTRQAEHGQRLAEENYMALYTALALLGAKNVVEKMGEYTGKAPTAIQRTIKSYLEKLGVAVEPEAVLKSPETVVAELMRRNVLTLSESLEPVLGGKRLAELLEPARQQLERDYALPALLNAVSAQAIKTYHAVNGHSVLLDMLRRGTPIRVETVIKHVESGAPVELEVLRHRVGGKTIWEQMPSDTKLKALRLLPVEQVMWIEKDSGFPKTRLDYRLIAEAICSGASPSTCTEYIYTTHPEYMEIPKTLKLVEHRGEKWIDAGLYRVQIERIAGDSAVFRVEEKASGRLLRAEARNLREAIYKAVREEAEEVSH